MNCRRPPGPYRARPALLGGDDNENPGLIGRPWIAIRSTGGVHGWTTFDKFLDALTASSGLGIDGSGLLDGTVKLAFESWAGA